MRVGPDTLNPAGLALVGQVERPRVLEDFARLERRAIEHRPEAYQAGLKALADQRAQGPDHPRPTPTSVEQFELYARV